MKYKTRQLFDALQTKEEDQFEIVYSKWQANCAAYAESLNRIRDELPASLRGFCQTSLHDGVVLKFETIGDSFLIDIDATNNPWGPRGVYQLVFGEIAIIKLGDLALGDWWLYEETHLHPQNAFEYRIMFDSSDVAIVANTFECNFRRTEKAR